MELVSKIFTVVSTYSLLCPSLLLLGRSVLLTAPYLDKLCEIYVMSVNMYCSISLPPMAVQEDVRSSGPSGFS